VEAGAGTKAGAEAATVGTEELATIAAELESLETVPLKMIEAAEAAATKGTGTSKFQTSGSVSAPVPALPAFKTAKSVELATFREMESSTSNNSGLSFDAAVNEGGEMELSSREPPLPLPSNGAFWPGMGDPITMGSEMGLELSLELALEQSATFLPESGGRRSWLIRTMAVQMPARTAPVAQRMMPSMGARNSTAVTARPIKRTSVITVKTTVVRWCVRKKFAAQRIPTENHGQRMGGKCQHSSPRGPGRTA
jgi:hypothetical protein